jgi:hypothetical protein
LSPVALPVRCNPALSASGTSRFPCDAATYTLVRTRHYCGVTRDRHDRPDRYSFTVETEEFYDCFCCRIAPLHTGSSAPFCGHSARGTAARFAGETGGGETSVGGGRAEFHPAGRCPRPQCRSVAGTGCGDSVQHVATGQSQSVCQGGNHAHGGADDSTLWTKPDDGPGHECRSGSGRSRAELVATYLEGARGAGILHAVVVAAAGRHQPGKSRTGRIVVPHCRDKLRSRARRPVRSVHHDERAGTPERGSPRDYRRDGRIAGSFEHSAIASGGNSREYCRPSKSCPTLYCLIPIFKKWKRWRP